MHADAKKLNVADTLAQLDNGLKVAIRNDPCNSNNKERTIWAEGFSGHWGLASPAFARSMRRRTSCRR
jgi:hypothetical protein